MFHLSRAYLLVSMVWEGGGGMAFLERMGNFLWNPWLLGLFLLFHGVSSLL